MKVPHSCITLLLLLVVTNVANSQEGRQRRQRKGKNYVFNSNNNDQQGDNIFQRNDGPRNIVIRTWPSGAQEVPIPVTAQSTAVVVIQFDGRFEYVSYSISVNRGFGITQAHLHCAPAGVNGPVIVFLFGPVGTGVNITRGVLSSGVFSNDRLLSNVTNFMNTTVCGVTINNIASLYSAIRMNRIYFNLHTLANPGGELRGQLFV